MGATTFSTVARGSTAQQAFDRAVAQARHEYGHGGYTGTIAEKDCFVMLNFPTPPPTITDAENYARELIHNRDPRVDDKWGPAGCIHLGSDLWLFFGWASE
jgi:hypothetical protein